MKRNALILILLGVTIGFDQLTKYWVRIQRMPMGRFLGGVFVLSHAENPGAFLSFGESLGQAARYGIFTIGVALFLIYGLVKVLRDRRLDIYSMLGWTFLVAGGIGNLIDRVMKETVTDFMFLGVGSLHTGVFNIADMAIVAGICLFLLSGFFEKRAPVAR